MKKLTIIALSFCFAFLTSCKQEPNKPKENKIEESIDKNIDKLTVTLEPKSGSNASGTIVFIEENGIVSMNATFSGLSEGEHAIHLHEKADCSSPDGKSTGGHWNPLGQPHGKWGTKEGYHKGDIGNFIANSDGAGTISFSTDQWCIGCEDQTKNILGKAIIVHEGVDDFVTQPTGAAGGRISCGGIIK